MAKMSGVGCKLSSEVVANIQHTRLYVILVQAQLKTLLHCRLNNPDPELVRFIKHTAMLVGSNRKEIIIVLIILC